MTLIKSQNYRQNRALIGKTKPLPKEQSLLAKQLHISERTFCGMMIQLISTG